MTELLSSLPLEVKFSGLAQVEVGGPFAAVEMHRGSPLLNRISFFYPVANSIDISPDYWQREQFHILSLGLKVGIGPKKWLPQEPFDLQLAPYLARYAKTDGEKKIAVSYRFCQSKPALVATIEITNNADEATSFELYTHLDASLRTSHTYAPKNRAWTEFDEMGSTVYVNFEDPTTGNVQLFVANAGQSPIGFGTEAAAIGPGETDENWWMGRTEPLPGTIIAPETPGQPIVAFVYRRKLAPEETMAVVQIVGSCRMGEGRDIVTCLLEHYEQEVKRYEAMVQAQAYNGVLEMGDRSLDHSAHWAKAILAANAHYIDAKIVPMPCPTQYNFFFTHDLLLTDLAAVCYDGARVKKDLDYLLTLANGTLPHAYYWKDDQYITESAKTDNWNHFWFILVSASYLRHSGDSATLESLYQLLAASLQAAMSNKQDDDLMWAHQPDWWDIGNNVGPRAYMTILAIRALREFVYISTVLDKEDVSLGEKEALAARMERQLVENLWDEDRGYLVNYYQDGSVDPHLYSGSLLAAHFRLLDLDRRAALVETAQNTLLDADLGVYNAFPMDFHQLGAYLNFNDNEAGDPGMYMNGGIWPHGNAWYALALLSIGKQAKALRFVKTAMTLQGITASPNGQPAMYEYRNSNAHDPTVYGKVDKPQFLWAAGWYLYVLYHLFGVRENEWNIALAPWLPKGQETVRFSLFVRGKAITVTVRGAGRYVANIEYDGVPSPSVVIPTETVIRKEIVVVLGIPQKPYVAETNSILLAGRLERAQSLVVDLQAFAGHENETTIISPWEPMSVTVTGTEPAPGWDVQWDEGVYWVHISFTHRASRDTMVITF